MDGLKRALKGLFKRGKKDKPQQSQQNDHSQHESPRQPQSRPPMRSESSAKPTAEPSQRASAPLAVPTQREQERPPQLPPLQSHGSPIQHAPPDTSKPLPPTHPLATGEHKKPQESIPIDHNAHPGPPPGTMVNRKPINTPVDIVEQQRGQGQMAHQDVPSRAPSLPSKNDDSKRSTLLSYRGSTEERPLSTTTGKGESALTHEERELHSLPNANSGLDESRAERMTDNRAKENATPMLSPAEARPTPAPNGTVFSDEKVAVLSEEPPPIQAVRALPGMSATSGPLEDFPEGGGFH